MMNKYLLAFTIIIQGLNVVCQNSFEYIISTPYDDFVFSTFQGDGYFYTLGLTGNSSETLAKALIGRFSDENDLVTKEIIKEDTSSMFFFGTKNNYGNLLLAGGISDSSSPGHLETLYVCEMTTGLEVVKEKYYNIVPDGYDWFMIYDMVVDQDNHIVLAGHLDDYAGTVNNCFLIVKLDMEGNLLNYNHYDTNYFDGRQRADLIAKQDGTGYYYFKGGAYEWVEFNNDLDYIDGGYKMDWPHYLGTIASVKYLPDGNLAFASQQSNSNYFYDLQLMIYNSELQNLKDTVIIEEGRQLPAIFKGMDYTDPENIWVLAHNDWVSPTSTEIYKIYIFDSQFNVKGSKYYGGDTDYDFYHLLATSDGGCLLTGNIRQELGTMLRDIFIKKVMPGDIITGIDENVFSDFKDVLVYPNPVSDKIFLTTGRPGLGFNLYNANGKVVCRSGIEANWQNEIDISWLAAGFYIYSITNSNRKAIDGGKLLKR
jgi:hypothetical protein